MKDTIAAIVVTYNRASLLKRCIKAILAQTILPDAIYIVDNRSTDNTQETLEEESWIDLKQTCEPSVDGVIYYNELKIDDKKIKIYYLYKDENNGGAGGFYSGMRAGYEAGYDWVWMMDDDGYPEKNALEELIKVSKKYDIKFLNSIVIKEEDHSKLLFPLDKGKDRKHYLNQEIVEGYVNPFNGTLISKEIIEKIGFVKKEMYIWGDEVEYKERTLFNKYRIATVSKAIHFHPSINKTKLMNVIPYVPLLKIPHIIKERKHIYYRNYGYIYITYNKKNESLKFTFKHSLYYIMRLDRVGLIKFFKSYRQGSNNIFP